VDTALQQLPGVAAAAAAVRRTAAGNQILVGYVAAAPGVALALAAARAELKTRLPAPLVPLLAEVDAMPTRGSGKVDRDALPWPLERLEGTGARVSLRDSAFGLATALCWATSPVFVKLGLRGLDSGLLGVTIGLAVAVVAYGAAIAVSGRPLRPSLERGRLAWKLVAGLFVGLSVWARWFSLELTSIGVVLALGLLSVPVVLALSPLVVGRRHERVTRRLVAGAALVVAGSLLLVAQ